jgi:hypothetical protein
MSTTSVTDDETFFNKKLKYTFHKSTPTTQFVQRVQLSSEETVQSKCFIKGKTSYGRHYHKFCSWSIYFCFCQPRCYCFLRPKWGRPKTYIYTPSVFRIYADIQVWITNENMCNKLNNLHTNIIWSKRSTDFKELSACSVWYHLKSYNYY